MMSDEFITILKSKQTHAFDSAWEIENGLCPCLTSAMGMGGGMTPMITNATINQCKTIEFMEQTRKHKVELPKELQGKKFRIRRLTPRECFRLMGVRDEDIDKLIAARKPTPNGDQRALSDSSLYKLAGNSIVAGGNFTDSNGNVDGVLYNLFRKMFIETDNENGQLTLF